MIFQLLWIKHPDWQKSCVFKFSILHVHSYPIQCISYPCVVRILQFKRALTELLLLQIVVKENLAWFVPLLLRRRPPQLSCSNDRRVQHSRDPASRLSFAASDLLPRRWQPWKLHYHHQPSRWPRGLHGSAREVALFRVCLRYASLNITCYFIVLFTD